MRASLVVTIPVLGTLLFAAGSAFPGESRTYTGGRFALELDGKPGVGFLRSVDGGATWAEVTEVPDPLNPLLVKKHIGQPKYDDVLVQFQVGDFDFMSDWVGAMLAGKPTRKSGAILAANFNYVEEGRLTFSEGLITEIVIPSCDGAAKDPAYMTLKIAPETTTWTAGTGASLEAPKNVTQKTWLPSNFRLKVGDLPCSRVNKIESFTIKQGVTESAVGETREPVKEPAKIEIPNLKITLDAVDAPAWDEWFDDFCIKGNNGQNQELGGSLTFLAPDLKTELMSLEFFQIGILRLARLPAPSADAQQAPRRITVELYVEKMELHTTLR